MTFFLAAVIPLLVIAVGILRVATSRGDEPARLLGWALLCTGAAKVFRLPTVSDEWADSLLHRVTGVWNLTDFSGMFLGVCAAICYATFTAGVVGRPLPRWALPAGIIGSGTAMMATFLASPVSGSPTSYMSADFPLTGWFAIYWAIYLIGLGGSSLMIALFIFWAVNRFRPSHLRTAVTFVGAAAGMLVGYSTHKVIDLIARNVAGMGWYREVAPTVSMATLLSSFVFLIACAATASWPGLKAWLQRWQLLRGRHEQWARIARADSAVVLDRSLIPANATGWQLLLSARDPVTTHRMLIEMADAIPVGETATPN